MSGLDSSPGSHIVQEVAPVVELKLPSPQTSHVVMSADLYCPAGQGSEIWESIFWNILAGFVFKLNCAEFQSYVLFSIFFSPQVGSVEYWNSVFWMQVTVSSPLISYPSLQLRDRTVSVETGNCLLAFMLVQVVFRRVQSEIVTFSKILESTWYNYLYCHINITL